MSSSPIEPRLSPFAECGQTTSNIGYREISTGRLVASVEIPSELIERAFLAKVSVEIALSADGEIASTVNGVSFAYSLARETISLDKLVETLLEGNNLHVEEATEGDLVALLNRLLRSVQAVQRAISLVQTTE